MSRFDIPECHAVLLTSSDCRIVVMWTSREDKTADRLPELTQSPQQSSSHSRRSPNLLLELSRDSWRTVTGADKESLAPRARAHSTVRQDEPAAEGEAQPASPEDWKPAHRDGSEWDPDAEVWRYLAGSRRWSQSSRDSIRARLRFSALHHHECEHRERRSASRVGLGA